MSSSLRASRESNAGPPLVPEPGPDGIRDSAELRRALRRDQVDLQREVILWQRWVRYVALGALGLLSVLSGRGGQLPLAPMFTVAAVYFAVVAGAAWYVARPNAQAGGGWLPALLVTADIAAMTALFFLTAPAEQQHRILILGVVSVQLSVFYFGWRQATWAATLILASYLYATLVATPFVPGPAIGVDAALLNATLFALVAGLLIVAFDRFRRRLNRLRLSCKLIEEGEPVGMLTLGEEKRPDDLTLLARSFDAMRERLAEQIGSDPLTGCLNRRSLEGRLGVEWRMAKRRGSNVAILALDLDHFKQINDTRGHPVGDIVLQQLAGIMRATARDTDAVARVGGDEFVILLPDTGWQGALAFAERLRRRVDDSAFGPQSSPLAITVSVGVALARGTDPISPEVLLEEADRALYKAKTAGRNRVFA